VLPTIYGPLYKNSLGVYMLRHCPPTATSISVVFAGHWNSTVEGLAQNVLKLYMDYDMVLFDKYVHCCRFGCESNCSDIVF
jgi:serine/threonine-protein phosphatase 2A regulatory subunit B'